MAIVARLTIQELTTGLGNLTQAERSSLQHWQNYRQDYQDAVVSVERLTTVSGRASLVGPARGMVAPQPYDVVWDFDFDNMTSGCASRRAGAEGVAARERRPWRRRSRSRTSRRVRYS